MNPSPFSSGENRLLHVTLDDMGGVKYNRRNAAINAANQRTQTQVVRGEQLKADLTDVARGAQADLAAGKINQQQFNDTMANNSRLAKSDSSAIIFGNEAAAINRGDQQLNQQGFQTYNAQTGQTTMAPDLGNIDQGALDRLMAGSKDGSTPPMTYDQALERVQSLRPSIQQTTSTTGLPGGTVRKSIGDTLKDDIAKSDAAIDATYNRLRAEGGIVNTAMVEEEKRRAREQITNQANVDQRDAQMQQQQKDAETRSNALPEGDAPTAKGETKGDIKPNPVSQSNEAQIQALQNVLNTNPVFAGSGYNEILSALLGRKSSVDAEEIFMQRMADFMREDKDGSGAADAVERQAVDSKDRLTEWANENRVIQQRHLDIAKETAEINKSMQEFEKQKFEINQKIREQEQVEANIENEQRNRRIANKMGIETDTSGLKSMRDEVRKGKEALQRLSEFGDAQRGQYALQIGRQYSLDVNNALLQYDEKQLIIDSNFEQSLKEIDNTVSIDAKERREKKDAIWKEYWDMKNLQDKESAQTLREAGNVMISTIRQDKEDRMKAEDNALERIDYLLSNYPRESVSEAIKELGKNVTSFDVQALIDNPTSAEIQKAEAAMAKRSGGGYAANFFPQDMQTTIEPEITYEEFQSMKISEMEQEQMQSFTPQKQAELMAENQEKWSEQYKAAYLSAGNMKASSDLVGQFGQPVVDAARQVMNGTYGGTNPVKNAAKAFNVSEGQVATALAKLRQSGEIADTAVLSPEQQNAWGKLKKSLEADPYYTTYNGARLAIGRIEAALKEQNGVSDIAAINGFQNGIVDPGATVRSEDVGLIQSARSWASRVDLDYWREKVMKGSKLPQSVREQMAQTAKSITDAYERAYLEQTLPKYQQEITQSGLPQSVLQKYGAQNQNTSVSKEVQSFTDTYFQ